MNGIAFELIDRIARMEAMHVPHAQIAMALGLDETHVSTIVIAPKCQEMVRNLLAQQFDKAQTLNDGWDMIEAAGANVVLQSLQVNPDADFALRAVIAANRASRRGTHGNRPIQADAGARVVVELNANFVEKLQQNFQILPPVEPKSLKQKAADFMAPGDVENLLRTTADADLDDFLDNEASLAIEYETEAQKQIVAQPIPERPKEQAWTNLGGKQVTKVHPQKKAQVGIDLAKLQAVLAPV